MLCPNSYVLLLVVLYECFITCYTEPIESASSLDINMSWSRTSLSHRSKIWYKMWYERLHELWTEDVWYSLSCSELSCQFLIVLKGFGCHSRVSGWWSREDKRAVTVEIFSCDPLCLFSNCTIYCTDCTFLSWLWNRDKDTDL